MATTANGQLSRARLHSNELERSELGDRIAAGGPRPQVGDAVRQVVPVGLEIHSVAGHDQAINVDGAVWAVHHVESDVGPTAGERHELMLESVSAAGSPRSSCSLTAIHAHKPFDDGYLTLAHELEQVLPLDGLDVGIKPIVEAKAASFSIVSGPNDHSPISPDWL